MVRQILKVEKPGNEHASMGVSMFEKLPEKFPPAMQIRPGRFSLDGGIKLFGLVRLKDPVLMYSEGGYLYKISKGAYLATSPAVYGPLLEDRIKIWNRAEEEITNG